MASQVDVVAGDRDMGGTMRLGSYPASLQKGSVAATAEAWAAAWSAGKVDALYALLDRNTRTAVSPDQFTTSYGNFRTETTQTKVSATVDSVREPKETNDPGANLSVQLSTAYFGEWEYTIALHLNRSNQGHVFFGLFPTQL